MSRVPYKESSDRNELCFHEWMSCECHEEAVKDDNKKAR